MKTPCNTIPSLAVLSALILFGLARAGAEDQPLELSLVSEHTAITPGRPFTLGLFLQHQPHHHSYWKEPGIVGLATSLTWELPAGFSAGEIQWPIPEIVDMRGHAAYGYTKDTLLVVDLNAPTHLKPGDKVTLKAKAAYMCCSQERCTPGFKDLGITLPVQHAGHPRSPDEAWSPIFAKARDAFPRAAPDWKGRARDAGEHYEVRLDAPADVELPEGETLYWFSTSGQVNSEKPQTIRREGNVVYLSLPKHPFADAEAKAFAGILRSENGWAAGERRVAGLAITVPMGNVSPAGDIR